MDVPKGELLPAYTPYVKDSGVEYLEILVYGDAGTGFAEQQAVADEMSAYVSDAATDVTFIINLGDSFYPDGVDSIDDPLWDLYFEDIYDPGVLTMPFYSILGNHDWNGSAAAQLLYESENSDRWRMPAKYYSFSETLPDATVVDFFFLDTVSLLAGDVDQLLWLDRQLEQSDARWRIVSGHHPLFSYGSHGFNGLLIALLQPILDGRADLYLAGHEHDLQILGPLNGVWHIVDGSAGTVRSTGVGDLTTFAASRSGFMALLISHDEIACRVLEAGAGEIYSAVLP